MCSNVKQSLFSLWRCINQAPICCCFQCKNQNPHAIGINESTVAHLNVQERLSDGNLAFERLPEVLTEIPLDDADDLNFTLGTLQPRDVITTEPYATSHLEVTDMSNDVLRPDDMFQRWPQVQMARKDLRYFDSLGQGSFGWIVRGRYRTSDGLGKPNISNDQSVIVCMLKEEANSDSQRAFLEETQLAAQFSFHFDDVPITNVVTNVDSKNIVKLIGICIEKPPYLAIYEECKLGDLKTFLLDRKELLLANENFSGLMLQFCQNVTSGLHYLHEAQCIPYDLATRCCQVTSSMEIKIGDYGMARFLYPNDYLRIQRFGMEEEVNDDDKLPLRWLPPEILAHLNNKKYDMKKRLNSIPRSSSIWTLGVTLWEIAMLGGTPFSSIYSNQFQSNINVEALLRDASTNGPGAITRKCYGTDAIESMVRLCTAADPAKRPTCQRLIAYLDAISESHIKLSNEKINV